MRNLLDHAFGLLTCENAEKVSAGSVPQHGMHMVS